MHWYLVHDLYVASLPPVQYSAVTIHIMYNLNHVKSIIQEIYITILIVLYKIHVVLGNVSILDNSSACIVILTIVVLGCH